MISYLYSTKQKKNHFYTLIHATSGTMDFESKIKENKKMFVSIARNLTRLKIETDRYVESIVFATSFLHLVTGKKRLRMFLTLSPVNSKQRPK